MAKESLIRKGWLLGFLIGALPNIAFYALNNSKAGRVARSLNEGEEHESEEEVRTVVMRWSRHSLTNSPLLLCTA